MRLASWLPILVSTQTELHGDGVVLHADLGLWCHDGICLPSLHHVFVLWLRVKFGLEHAMVGFGWLVELQFVLSSLPRECYL